MPRNIARRASAVVACSIAILCYSVVARAQGAVDTFDPGANQVVSAMAVQPDGKIIIGGGFTGLGGSTGATLRNHIGRLNADGTVDPTFNPGANSIVQAIAVQPDGKILIGGNFTSVGGGTGLTSIKNHIARFNSDGTVDESFDPGANNHIYAIVVQPDGKILLGGDFTTLGGGGTGTTARLSLGRVNADGTLGQLQSRRFQDWRYGDRLYDGAATGWEGGRRRLLQRPRRRHRRDGAQLHRADQRRRHGGYAVRSRRDVLCLRPRAAGRRQDRRGWRLHRHRQWRGHRIRAAVAHRADQYRRHD